jgi:hypothetical protein
MMTFDILFLVALIVIHAARHYHWVKKCGRWF